jgi:hypothetical protein
MKGLRATIATVTVVIASVVVVQQAPAFRSNPNGIVFRAIGIFQGEVEEGKCKVPTASQAIADGSRSICRDATEIVSAEGTSVFPTVMFPELATFANFCGGFVGMQNNMINQAINVSKVKIRYRIPGRGFPVLCRGFRVFKTFIGSRIDPFNSINPSPFGAPNINFVQLLPIYSPEMFDCLRDPQRGNVQAPVTVGARIILFGQMDDGGKIKSNRVRYSLTLLPPGSTPPAASGGSPPVGVPTRCAAPVQ